MKSGQLTALSALALHSDVRVVRLRYEQGPPPCIYPLLISPRPCGDAALSRPLFGRAELRWEFLVSRSAKFFGLSRNLRNKIFRKKMKTECCLNLGEGCGSASSRSGLRRRHGWRFPLQAGDVEHGRVPRRDEAEPQPFPKSPSKRRAY